MDPLVLLTMMDKPDKPKLRRNGPLGLFLHRCMTWPVAEWNAWQHIPSSLHFVNPEEWRLNSREFSHAENHIMIFL